MSEETVSLHTLSRNAGREVAPNQSTAYKFTYETFPAWGDFVYLFFKQAIEGITEGSPPATLTDAIRVLRVLDAIYECAQLEKPIKIPAHD